MSDALENIFSVIIKSEIIAQNGKKKHKEVKDGIDQLKTRLQKQEILKKDHVAKKDKLELALADANIGLTIIKVKEKFLCSELTAVKEKVNAEKKRYNDLERSLAALCTEFIKDVDIFSIDYNLSSSGTEKRFHTAVECLKSLGVEKDKLEFEVNAVNDFNHELKKLLDCKLSGTDKLNAFNKKIEDVNYEIESQIVRINELESKVSHLITEPDHGENFNKIKEDLQIFEVTELQSEIDKFQIELHSLIKKLHKREAHSLREQYKHWQRQQQQKNSYNGLKKENASIPEQQSYPDSHTGRAVIISDNSDEVQHEDISMMTDETVKIESS